MKNIGFYIILLFALLWTAPLFAADLKVPSKPRGFICDYAHLLRDSAASLDKAAKNDFRLMGYRFYVVTVPDTYVPDIDTFGVRICTAWHICGDDSALLLLISAGDTSAMRMFSGSRVSSNFTPEIMTYILDGVSAQRKNFGIQQAVSIYLVKTYLQMRDAGDAARQSDFQEFDAKYHAAFPPPDQNAIEMAKPSTGRYQLHILLLMFVCNTIVLSYLIMYIRYKMKFMR